MIKKSAIVSAQYIMFDDDERHLISQIFKAINSMSISFLITDNRHKKTTHFSIFVHVAEVPTISEYCKVSPFFSYKI